MSRRPTGRSRRFPVRRVGAAPAPVTLPTTSLIGQWELRDATLSGSNVTALVDRSAAGNSLTIAGTGNEVTLAADADYGGELVGVFNAGKYLQRATFVGGAETQPNTVLCLGEWADTTSGRMFYDGGGTSTRHGLLNGAGAIQAYSGTGMNVGTVVAGAVVPSLVIFNGANTLPRVSSDWSAAGVAVSTGTHDLNGFTIGNRFGTIGDSRLIGRVAICAVWAKALDAAEIAQVAAYLNQEFGQTITV